MGDLNLGEGGRPRGQQGWGAEPLKTNFADMSVFSKRAGAGALGRTGLRLLLLPEQGST